MTQLEDKQPLKAFGMISLTGGSLRALCVIHKCSGLWGLIS